MCSATTFDDFIISSVDLCNFLAKSAVIRTYEMFNNYRTHTEDIKNSTYIIYISTFQPYQQDAWPR